jgi:hypothetical protein
MARCAREKRKGWFSFSDFVRKTEPLSLFFLANKASHKVVFKGILPVLKRIHKELLFY